MEDRKSIILSLLNAGERIHPGSLSARFGVSEDTIRRDLRALASQGLIRRVYGGALPPSPVSPVYADRLRESPRAKREMAQAVTGYLKPGQTVFLDAGTSAAAVAEQLPRDLKLTVVTHSLPAATALAEKPGVEVIFLGGRVLHTTIATVGAEVVAGYGRVRADVCVLGVASAHADAGLTVFEHEDAEVKRAIVANAAEVIVLAAGEKLGTTAPFLVCPASQVDRLITDAHASGEATAALRDRGVEVTIARPGVARP